MVRATLLITIALVASSASVSAAEPRERLAFLVGDWTIEGREASFREVCEWFPGRSHVVCNSESRRDTGTSRGVSVLSYSDEKKRHVYYHYGSSGAVSVMDIFTDGNSLVATGQKIVGADVIREQVWMTPRGDDRFEFREQTSTNGGAWETTAHFTYVRRAAPKEVAQ